jgi:hypothetical protein
MVAGRGDRAGEEARQKRGVAGRGLAGVVGLDRWLIRSVSATPWRPRRGRKNRENFMKNLLFFTAATLLLIESTVAYAIGDSVFTVRPRRGV